MRLTKLEKIELNSSLEQAFESWRKDKDNIDLRNEFLLKTEALIDIVIRPFKENKTSASYEDLRQDGYIGVLSSMEKICELSYEKGFLYKKILSYIRKQVLLSLDSSDLIKLESALFTSLYKLKKFQSGFKEQFGRPATRIEIEENSGIPKSAIKTLSIYYNLETLEKVTDILVPSFSEFGDNIALDGFNYSENETEHNNSLIEQENSLSSILKSEKENLIKSELEKLPKVEKFIFLSKYGAFGFERMTISEISTRSKMSIPKVFSIQKKIEESLKKNIKSIY